MNRPLRRLALATLLSTGLVSGCTSNEPSKIEFPAGTQIPKEAPPPKASATTNQSSGDPAQYSREVK